MLMGSDPLIGSQNFNQNDIDIMIVYDARYALKISIKISITKNTLN